MSCRALASGGSARVAGCRLSPARRSLAVTCPSPSGRRSRSCSLVVLASGRSHVSSVVRRRRSRGSCNGTLRSAPAGLSIGPRPHRRMPTVAPGDRSRPLPARARHRLLHPLKQPAILDDRLVGVQVVPVAEVDEPIEIGNHDVIGLAGRHHLDRPQQLRPPGERKLAAHVDLLERVDDAVALVFAPQLGLGKLGLGRVEVLVFAVPLLAPARSRARRRHLWASSACWFFSAGMNASAF